ncbi:MAG: hypothetical protein QXU45_09305 [Candidatus Bathyarchaeia archaeon]
MEMKEILNKRNKNYLALGIFIFSLLYRILLLQTKVYPAGPDVGLHNSIINSIILKNGNFLWNYYHMGGGPSLTHPGFHIFTAFVLLITGLPDYMAQYAVAVLFSSLIVLCAFLLTRAVWRLLFASLAAAFLAALSRYDIEMMAWGGYPNVVTLSIIPLIFYMLFREKTGARASLTISALLIGTLFITHSLSALTFTSIAIPFLILSFLSKKSPMNRKTQFIFAASIILGVLIASPFIIHVFPVYMGNVEKGMFTSAINEYRKAILLTRLVPLQLSFATLIPAFSFLLFSKKYRGTFFDSAGLLFCLWMIVPALLTQSFRVGLYTDYLRLLHFLIFPLIVFFALLIDHVCGYVAKVVGVYAQVKHVMVNPKMVHSLLLSITLIVFLLDFAPFFSGPEKGFLIADYYRVVYPQEFNSVEWIKQETPIGALFVSNHGYGWWVSGFGQRATLTSTDPQFLMIPHEFEASYIARTLLKTNFVLNNGFIEIAEDGGYVGRYNPMLSINCTRLLEPYPMLYFNESDITIFYKKGTSIETVDAATIPLKNLTLEATQELACITVIRENTQLILTRRVEVLKDTKFASFSLSLKSLSSEVSLQYFRVLLRAYGKVFQLEQTIGFLDENVKLCAQIIFEEKQPIPKLFTVGRTNFIELLYNAENPQKAEIKLIIGGFKVEKVEDNYVINLLADMVNSWSSKESTNLLIKIFDYREIIRLKGIAFIACQRKEYAIERFASDPMFNLVYINDRVAIFKVREHG